MVAQVAAEVGVLSQNPNFVSGRGETGQFEYSQEGSVEWVVPRLPGDPLPWRMLAGDFSPVSTVCEAKASWGVRVGGQGTNPKRGAWTGVRTGAHI